MQVSWWVELVVRPGCLDEFETLTGEMVISTQGESGVLGYQRFISEDRQTVYVSERYKAHIKLLDALKEEFPGDDIRRIRPGVSGADIFHTVMRNGQECGSILWESKNSTGWRDDYVTKLIRDQTATKADHAVLSTFKFPTGTAQVTHRDGVVIVNPARAVAIAHMLRKHLLTVHMHRLSKAERVEKMAALYDYMTSERCALHLNRIDSDAEGLLDLLIAEKKFHDNHWGKQALRYKSIQKAKADLDIEVGAIIGGVESVG